MAKKQSKLAQLRDATDRATIEHALEECNYNRTEAAALLGISRRMLLYKLDVLKLTKLPKGAGYFAARSAAAEEKRIARLDAARAARAARKAKKKARGKK